MDMADRVLPPRWRLHRAEWGRGSMEDLQWATPRML
jgi:hypothetical protein